ncbi:MAG: FHA domain-containing protein [Gammaproteobacteria bacterium]
MHFLSVWLCAFVSKHHAIIEIVEEEEGLAFYLQDLASTNHTYVNDRAIVRTRLHDGDMIRIGKNSFKFDASGPLPLLDAVELDFELPGAGETPSRTWNFSRRLRLIATE